MNDKLPEPIDASKTGAISIGSNIRIFSLGNGAFVIATTENLSSQLRELYGVSLYDEMRTALRAEAVLLVHSDNGDLGSFVPFAEADDLKSVLRPIVAELWREMKA